MQHVNIFAEGKTKKIKDDDASQDEINLGLKESYRCSRDVNKETL